jgi:hypothetical protein
LKLIWKCIAWWLAIVLVAGVLEECFKHPPGESQLMILHKGILLLALPVLVLASTILLLLLWSGVVWFFRLLGCVLLWLHGDGWLWDEVMRHN